MAGIVIRGVDIGATLEGVARELVDNPGPLLKVWGVRMLREVDDIFKAQGKPPWPPLAPSTVSAKRQGRGTSGRGTQALAGFRQGWDFMVAGSRLTVFHPDPKVVFHEHGTKGPYQIVAKNAKALALPFFPGRDAGEGTAGTGKAGRFSLAGAGRSRRTKTATLVTPGGARRVPFTNVTFRKRVTHPGLKVRRQLPTEEQAVPMLIAEGNAFVRHLVARRTVRHA